MSDNSSESFRASFRCSSNTNSVQFFFLTWKQCQRLWQRLWRECTIENGWSHGLSVGKAKAGPRQTGHPEKFLLACFPMPSPYAWAGRHFPARDVRDGCQPRLPSCHGSLMLPSGAAQHV